MGVKSLTDLTFGCRGGKKINFLGSTELNGGGSRVCFVMFEVSYVRECSGPCN